MSTQAWQEFVVHVNVIDLHVTRTGGDKPPLVLAHGITDDGLCWGRAAKVWQTDYDVIMVDARGHGRSSKPDKEEAYTIDTMVADLAALIDALGLQQPGLIGHSMGAAVAAQLAAEYPGQVGYLVLEDPPWSEQRDALSEQERAVMAADWKQDMESNRGREASEIIAKHRKTRIDQACPSWLDEEYESWIIAKKRVSPQVMNIVATDWPDWRVTVTQLRCPTLLLYGNSNLGGIVTPAIADAVSSLNKRIQVRCVQGTGHCIRRDDFSEYIEAISYFTNQLTTHGSSP
ncbi:MAG: alpha/beta hydrolase [Chloroflexi bacterium]|nr:alpha/beta hydrolase [Chloroflexota bacterium]